MTLKHYAFAPLVLRQQGYRQMVDFKPQGLWVSVEGPDDWVQWCLAEDYRFGRFVHTVKLRKSNHICFLRTPSEIRDFTSDHRVERYPGDRLGINWPDVARAFSGIVIAPYQWECRHDPETFWYYPWDCASGCIWDLNAISKISDHEEWAGTVNSASPDSTKEPEGPK
jgi:hypothetical protein